MNRIDNKGHGADLQHRENQHFYSRIGNYEENKAGMCVASEQKRDDFMQYTEEKKERKGRKEQRGRTLAMQKHEERVSERGE